MPPGGLFDSGGAHRAPAARGRFRAEKLTSCVTRAFRRASPSSNYVNGSSFPRFAACVMLGHESSPTHRSSARDLCNRWAGRCAAGNTGRGKAAACRRDERHGRDVRGYAVLSGRTEGQWLPGLPAPRDVHAHHRSGRTVADKQHPDFFRRSHVGLRSRRLDRGWPHWRPSGPSSSNPDLIGVTTPSAAARS